MKASVKKMLKCFRFHMSIVLLLLLMFLAACVYNSGRDVINRSTFAKFDLDEFMGRWYEVARFDNRFERGMRNVTADYRLLDDGTVEVINRGDRGGEPHEAIGHAKATATPGRLRVSFFWIFYSDYNILEMAPDGEWVLIGSRSPRFLWILSRTPSLAGSTLDYIVELANRRGYNTENLIFDSSRISN